MTTPRRWTMEDVGERPLTVNRVARMHRQIDVAEVKMFAGYDWVDLDAPCPHQCEHRGLTTIAWGPTRSLYELLLCDNCQCRSWRDGRAYELKAIYPEEARFFKDNLDWREVDYHGTQGPPTGRCAPTG